jgi:Cu/Zn superoxide dismutase
MHMMGSGCQQQEQTDMEPSAEQTGEMQAMETSEKMKVADAIAVLHPTEGNNAHGTVTFEKGENGIVVCGLFEGLTPGKHGFHIHEYGDCSAADATTDVGHYNPKGMEHGARTDEVRHVGDLGNIEANEDGMATFEFTDPHLALDGPHSILGRAVVVHAKVHTSDMKPTESGMTPGDGFPVGELDTRIGPVKVGSMICFDRGFPESARILMLNGAELVLTPNACTLEEKRLDQFKVRAWENQMCVAMTNYPEPVNNGHSLAYDQEGNTVVIGGEREGIFFAVFDIARLRERRAKTSWGNAFRRPHRYHPLISTEKNDLWKRTSKNVEGDGGEYKTEER